MLEEVLTMLFTVFLSLCSLCVFVPFFEEEKELQRETVKECITSLRDSNRINQIKENTCRKLDMWPVNKFGCDIIVTI